MRLYEDWCLSHGYPPAEPTEHRLALWAAECPSAASTALRRQLSVRRATGLTASAQPASRALPASVFDRRAGESWFSVPEALRVLPGGLHGRRDGFLLAVLDGGASVNGGRCLAENDIALFPRPAVAGSEPALAEDPASCARCAVTRWLRVVGPASRGAKYEVREILAAGGDHTVHDCWAGLDGSWRGAPQLLPSIDRHSWLGGAPLSRRAVFTILNKRLRRVNAVDGSASVERSPMGPDNRFAEASLQDLADVSDMLDFDLNALLARADVILGDAQALAERLAELTV